MRDYKYATAEEFVAESIQAKMKWFARQLRYKDNPTEIETWARSMSLLIDLLKRTNVVGEKGIGGGTVKKRIPPQMRKLTISPPCEITLHQAKVASCIVVSGQVTSKGSESIAAKQLEPKKIWGLKGTEKLVETKERPQVMMEVEDNDGVPNGANSLGIRKLNMPHSIELSTERADDQVIAKDVANSATDELNLDETKRRAKLVEEEKEKWLNGICDRLGREMDDTVDCEDVLYQYNTDWKFNRMLKEIANDLKYKLKKDSNGYLLPEKLWKYLYSEINNILP